MNRACLLALGVALLSADVRAAAVFVSGDVPDWEQPYRYSGGSPNGGPGPDPNPGSGTDPWDAWCAPTSGANLAGHWDDVRSVAVADGTAFPFSTVTWPNGASWQDYQADGVSRPQRMTAYSHGLDCRYIKEDNQPCVK